MPRISAGILLYRRTGAEIEVLLAHPGGPYFARKNDGAWGIPKGERNADEALEDTARREFNEETGLTITAPLTPLDHVRQSGGKLVYAWAAEGNCDPAEIRSNFCELEWPPRSGKHIQVPEVDRAAWFPLAEARTKIFGAQQPFLERLQKVESRK